MLSQTRRALEDFDNQHDFERFSADILNALGYRNVEPMAPAGGADGGCDIRFRDGDEPGMAFVTLEKKIREKFQRDLGKHDSGEGLIGLFCNVDVTPGQKLNFAKDAIAKGFRLEVFDIERLRSLLDSSLKEIRRRYLGIDDELTAQLRSQMAKLLRFPKAVPDDAKPPTVLETMLRDQIPRRLFELFMKYDEAVVREVPSIGGTFYEFMKMYYEFRTKVNEVEEELFMAAGKLSRSAFPAAWRIHLRYVLMRFAGMSREEIVSWGEFLNYGITWDDAERVFTELANNLELASSMSNLLEVYDHLSKDVTSLSAKVATSTG